MVSEAMRMTKTKRTRERVFADEDHCGLDGSYTFNGTSIVIVKFNVEYCNTVIKSETGIGMEIFLATIGGRDCNLY